MNEEELSSMPLGSTVYEAGVHPWVRDVRSGGWVHGQGTPNMVWNTSKTMAKRNCTREPKLTIDQKIRAAIKVECDRQHVGEDRQIMLRQAYNDAQGHLEDHGQLHEIILLELARTLEPSNGGVYRTTPVSFNGVVGGVPPRTIARAMENWIEWFVAAMSWPDGLAEGEGEHLIKEFLDIHPFSDGNGRTAWLLRVWMLNQWDDPQPLPDYYKEA